MQPTNNDLKFKFKVSSLFIQVTIVNFQNNSRKKIATAKNKNIAKLLKD